MTYNLDYKLVYTPRLETYDSVFDRDVNLFCKDNKIHIRLRDYDSEEVISGFINKLTFLVTYLINCQWKLNIVAADSDQAIIDCFVERSKEAKTLIETIRDASNNASAGLHVLPNYRKISKYSKLGSININYKDILQVTDGVVTSGSLDFILNKLRVSLTTFLLDDAYELVITKKEPTVNLYSKYSNKTSKQKETKSEDLVSLW